MEFRLIEDELPIKGKDIIGICDNGDKHFVFRCNCHNQDCKEWKSSIIGGTIFVDIIKWKYEDGK